MISAKWRELFHRRLYQTVHHSVLFFLLSWTGVALVAQANLYQQGSFLPAMVLLLVAALGFAACTRVHQEIGNMFGKLPISSLGMKIYSSICFVLLIVVPMALFVILGESLLLGSILPLVVGLAAGLIAYQSKGHLNEPINKGAEVGE